MDDNVTTVVVRQLPNDNRSLDQFIMDHARDVERVGIEQAVALLIPQSHLLLYASPDHIRGS
jgi:hypothetical protein